MRPYEHKKNDSRAEVVWNHTTVTPAMRAAIKKQLPMCIWFTGLSGSGKSTLANALEAQLNRRGLHTMLLDGDNVRHGLCKDLGMSDADRGENIRRVAEVAKIMVDAGLIVVTAFISPFTKDREAARTRFPVGRFFEIHVKTSLAACEERDPKGLYQKARRGEIKSFTGVDSPYECPVDPELVVETEGQSIESCIEYVLAQIPLSSL